MACSKMIIDLEASRTTMWKEQLMDTSPSDSSDLLRRHILPDRVKGSLDCDWL